MEPKKHKLSKFIVSIFVLIIVFAFGAAGGYLGWFDEVAEMFISMIG